MLHTITTYTTRYRWDTDADGDPCESPTELGTESDTDTMTPDEFDTEDGLSAVDLVVRFFDRVNSVEPSSTPGFQADLWYSEIDPYQDPYTGVVETRTFHLNGFTVDEQRDIWSRLVD